MDGTKTTDATRQLEKDALRYVIPHFASNEELQKGPKIFVRGEGCYLFDVQGRRYLDTFASLLTTICGHRRPEVAAAIKDQLEKLEFFPNYVDTFTEPLIKLAKKLAAIMPGDLSVSFFVNSGSEANETALKMARQHFWEKGEKNRHKILFRRFSYHGTTLGGCSATGIPWFREYFEPLLTRNCVPTVSARCYDCEIRLKPETCGLRCLDLVEQQIQWEGPDSIAAFIMDPLPGSNIGYPVPTRGLHAESQGALRHVRNSPDLRRDSDRVRQDRQDVRLRALGRCPGHHDHRQGLLGRLRSAGRDGRLRKNRRGLSRTRA